MHKLSNGMLVSGAKNCGIQVLNPEDDFKVVFNLTGSYSHVLELENGMFVVGGNFLIIINPSNDFKIVANLTVNSSNIKPIQLSNGMLATACNNFTKEERIYYKIFGEELVQFDNYPTINIWDPSENFNLVATLMIEKTNFEIDHVKQLSNGMLISVIFTTSHPDKGIQDFTIKVWNPKDNYNLVANFTDKENSIQSIYEISNGMLLTIGQYGKIKVYDSNDSFKLVSIFNFSQKESFKPNCIELTNGDLVITDYNTFTVWKPYENFKLAHNKTIEGIKHEHVKQLSNSMIAVIISNTKEADMIEILDPNFFYQVYYVLYASDYHTNLKFASFIQLSNGLLAVYGVDNIFFWDINLKY